MVGSIRALLAGFLLVSIAPAQGGVSEFWRKFRDAIPANDPKELARLVRKEPENAIWTLSDAAQSFQVNQNPELGTAIEKLVAAWKEAFSNNFLDKYYDDLRNFDQSQWNEWRKTLGRWNGLLAADQKFQKGELDADGQAKYQTDARTLAETFEALGDKYLAGTCFYWSGAAVDPDRGSKIPDLAKAIEAYKKVLKAREDLDYKDQWYSDLSSLVTRMEAELKKGPAKKPGDNKPGKPGEPGKPGAGAPLGGSELFAKDSKWMPAVSKFLMTAPADFERPGWNTDEFYLDWMAVGLQGKPSGKAVEGKLPFFDISKEAKFLREADAKYAFDPGDKTALPIKLGKPTPFEFKLPNTGAEYAFTAAMGSNQEAFHGSTINVSSDDSYAQIYYSSAASRLVDVAGQKVRVFDDNCDGKMGSDPFALKDFGQRMEGGLPFLDSMVIGGAKRAVPFSGFVKIGPKWYRLKADAEGVGLKFQARELDIKTGTLKLDWKGPANSKPKYMIVREAGELTGAYFDLAGAEKGVEVPAGEYEFFFGIYRNGKGKQVQKYAVLPGKDPKKYKVEPGATVTIAMGAPFKFQFKSSQDGTDVSVTGKSVEIFGAGEEHYTLLSDEVPRPKVEIRKPGAKTGTEIGEMKRGERKDKDPLSVLCWPGDFKGKKPDATAVEIRLVEEHKWFGQIASDWLK